MHIISPDCCWFAMSKMKDRNKEGNNVLEIWDCSTGKTARKIAMESPLEQIVFSQDAKWLLVAIQGEPTVRMYEVATGKECYNLHLWYKGIGHMAFAPDSQSFYVGDASQGKISRWKTATGELMANYASPLDYAVQQLGFARPDEPVALAQVGHIVHAWEVTTGKIISATNVFRQPIVAVHFSQQGELFIGGEQGQASWWNPETGRKTRDLKLEIAARASINYRLGMAVHGEFLVHFDACPRSEREAGISEFKSGKFLYSEESQWALTLSLFANGQKAASLQRKTVRLWNTREGDDYAKFDLPLTESFHQAHMSVSESGRFFAVATDGNEGGDVLLFDHEKRTILRTWQIEASNTRMLRFSLDNRWLVFSEANDALRLSRLGQNLSGTLLKLPGSEITQCVAFSPEGRQLACATVDGTSPQQPGRIVIYELASKKVRREFLGHKTGIIHCLAYSPDAGLLASGASDTTAMVWQAGLRSTPKTDKTFAGKELATAFTQMAGDDAKLAFEAMMRLVQTPRQTIALLTQHIPPAAKADLQGRSVAEWIGDLGSEQYAVRIKAAALLFSIGPAVDADLRAALARPKNLETKRRLEDLLARLAARELTTQEILHVRAVELAEAIASKQAGALLTRWTTGEPGATLTDEARLALARMPQ
jgi:WD40 repeat protein